MFAKKHEFDSLPTSDQDEDDWDNNLENKSRAAASRSPSWRRFMTNGTLLLALFFAVLVGLGLVATYASSRSEPKWKDCGNDPETARSRGCSFDLISFAWQTPECFDGDLVNEFASWSEGEGNGDWEFWGDSNYTSPRTQQQALKGEEVMWVHWHYHMVHCTFMWRQMHRAYERGWIDAHLGNYNHTLHCQKMILMDPEEAEHKKVKARLIYPECLRVADKHDAITDDTYQP